MSSRDTYHHGNLRRALLGFNLGKGITGGSDGHRVSQMGKTVTYAPCRRSRRGCSKSMKSMPIRPLSDRFPAE